MKKTEGTFLAGTSLFDQSGATYNEGLSVFQFANDTTYE